MRSAFLAVFLLAVGCSHFTETRFGNFDAAMAKAQQVKDPPIYSADALPSDLPSYVVYANIHGDFETRTPRPAWLLQDANERGFAPDFLIYRDHGAASSGGTAGVIVSGAVFMGPPKRRGQGSVLLCRIAPSSPGVKINEISMVTAVDDEVRSCGIQEGDTLLTLNGAEVKAASERQVSPWQAARFAVKPGDDVKAVWIRPGTGRMEGVLKAQPPQPMTKAPSIINPPSRSNQPAAVSDF